MQRCGVVIFISGRGSNMVRLVEAAKNYTVRAVISNDPEAAGLQEAAKRKIPTYSVPRAQFASTQEHKAALFKKAHSFAPDFIALAGYMQIVSPQEIQRMPKRILNIHPALLPQYPGLDTHKRALADQARFHGCSVHYVDEGIDTGEIIAQARCKVLPNDTEDSLAARVLELEHYLYPAVLNSLSQ